MLNYLGQLRLYSLLDLIVLLIATRATPVELIGAVLLHVGFLAYLESRHEHSYRKKVPKYLWVLLCLAGLILYSHIAGLFYVLFSYLYTLKNRKSFAVLSPVMRGLQSYFLVAGISGYGSGLAFLAMVMMIIRNFCGDLRDVEKDGKENMKTLPVVMGLKKNIKYVHLIVTLVTTFVWFEYTNLSPYLLLPIFLIQILSYNLTPR